MMIECIADHCNAMNCDCVCVMTNALCPLYDLDNYRCMLECIPADWDIQKIKKAFDDLKTFDHGR